MHHCGILELVAYGLWPKMKLLVGNSLTMVIIAIQSSSHGYFFLFLSTLLLSLTVIVLCMNTYTHSLFKLNPMITRCFKCCVKTSILVFVAGSVQANEKGNLESAFSSRLTKLSNVIVESETRLYNTEDSNPQKMVADSGWYRFKLFNLKSSYRMDYQWFSTQSASKEATSSAARYDDSSGVRTVVGQNFAVDGVYARIDRDHDPNINWNRVIGVLGITVGTKDSILLEALTLSDSWVIEESDSEVVITYDLPTDWPGGLKGRRVIICDPSRGYCPTLITLSLGDNEEMGAKWREERIELTDFQEHNGLWIPMQFDETIRASVLPDGTQAKTLTCVSSISFGSVELDDLNVKIPLGTEVVNSLEGTTYVIGKDSVRTEQQALAGSTVSTLEGQREGSRYRSTAMIMTAAIVATLSVLVLRKRFRA